MSAYIVSNEVINRILSGIESGRFNNNLSIGIPRPSAAHCTELLNAPIEELGQELYKLNYLAVCKRYPDAGHNDLPGPYNDGALLGYEYKPIFPGPTLQQLYKDLSCLIYQCSEGDIPDRALYKELVDYKIDLAEAFLNRSPGYNDLPWG